MADDGSPTPLAADRLWTIADVVRFLGVSRYKAYGLKARIGYVPLVRQVRFGYPALPDGRKESTGLRDQGAAETSGRRGS